MICEPNCPSFEVRIFTARSIDPISQKLADGTINHVEWRRQIGELLDAHMATMQTSCTCPVAP